MEFPLLLKLSFAVFGIVYLIRYTDGPINIFLRFRQLMGIWQYEVEKSDEIIEEIGEGFLAKLFSCFWCLITWVSLFLILIFYGIDILAWFACIGISGFIYEIVVRNDGQIKRLGE